MPRSKFIKCEPLPEDLTDEDPGIMYPMEFMFQLTKEHDHVVLQRWEDAMRHLKVEFRKLEFCTPPRMYGNRLAHMVSEYEVQDNDEHLGRKSDFWTLPDPVHGYSQALQKVYVYKVIFGRLMCWYMPCARCFGRGCFVGRKAGYTTKGMGIHLLGDHTRICWRCCGFQTDPGWHRRLEQGTNVFQLWREFYKKGQVEKPRAISY